MLSWGPPEVACPLGVSPAWATLFVATVPPVPPPHSGLMLEASEETAMFAGCPTLPCSLPSAEAGSTLREGLAGVAPSLGPQ